jgi:hypothetical protein
MSTGDFRIDLVCRWVAAELAYRLQYHRALNGISFCRGLRLLNRNIVLFRIIY